MARRLGRPVKFVRPGRYIFNMLVFLLAIGAIVYYLSPWSPQPNTLLIEAFQANVALNCARRALFLQLSVGLKAFLKRLIRRARACRGRRLLVGLWSSRCWIQIGKGGV